MTQISQNLSALGTSRRKMVIGAAFDQIIGMKLSDTYKRAVLGTGNQRKPSKRPQFLRLYFALRARNFPVSPASIDMAQKQEIARSLAKKQRADARRQRHAMPPHLTLAGNEDQRAAWIEMRKMTSRRSSHHHLAAE